MSVYFPESFIADHEAAEGIDDWVNVSHNQATLSHPIEHGRWWPLPVVDGNGEITFTLNCRDGRDQWEITKSVTIPPDPSMCGSLMS